MFLTAPASRCCMAIRLPRFMGRMSSVAPAFRRPAYVLAVGVTGIAGQVKVCCPVRDLLPVFVLSFFESFDDGWGGKFRLLL